MKLEQRSGLWAPFRATLCSAALVLTSFVGLAGESHEHPPGVPLNPAVMITAPKPMFPPEIEAMRREIDAEQDRLRREYKLLVAVVAEEKENDSPDLHSPKWTELKNGWARLRERRAILDKMLEEHRARIAKDRTETPFDPAAAEMVGETET